VRVLRLVVVAVGVGALLAVVPGIGSSESRTAQSAQQCGREEFIAGLEAVFGRFKTLAAANQFRTKVVAAGFTNANVIPDCPSGYKVSLRGMESFDIAVDLQDEARREHFTPTIECIKAKDDVGELEVVFGHRRNRSEASDLVTQATALGFGGLQLEADPCGGFEVMFKGFSSRDQAEEFAAEAKQAGFDVVIEQS
jgi:cell division septation protein DedD